MKKTNIKSFIANGLVHTPPYSSHKFSRILYLFFLAVTLMVSGNVWGDQITYSGTEKFYFNGWQREGDNCWDFTTASACMKIRFCNGDSEGSVLSTNKISDSENGIFEVTVPAGTWDKVQVIRYSSDCNNWWTGGKKEELKTGKNYLHGTLNSSAAMETYGSGGGDAPQSGACSFKKGTTIYLNLNGNDWPKDGGKPAAMFYYVDNANKNYGNKSTSWGGEMTESKQIGSGNYVLCTQVSGDYWKVTVPDDNLAHVRFVRVQASNADWTWNCQKNKLALSDMGSNNCVKLGGWDANASWENYSSGSAVEKSCPVDPSTPTVTNTYRLRGDLWLSSGDWKGGSSSNIPLFVNSNDNTTASVSYVMPAAQARLTLTKDGNDGETSDLWNGDKSVTNKLNKTSFSSSKYYIAAQASVKKYTFIYEAATGKFYGYYSDYDIDQSNWDVYIDDAKKGTTDANGELTISGLSSSSDGTAHTIYLRKKDASTEIHGINWFGGLYIDKNASNVAWGTQYVYYDATKFASTEWPIVGNKDAKGRFKLNEAKDIKVTFDGGKITINKVTPAADQVTVQFNTNYGSSVPSQSIDKGGKATQPSNPSKNNNNFLGWYQNPDFSGSTFDFANTVINENITLYAKWDYNGTIYYVNGSNLGIDGWISSDWDPNMPKAPLMTDAGDHIEHVVPVAFKKGDDIRFKLVPCNQKWSDNNSCWNNALNWDPNFSIDRSTATLATYQADGTNYKINLTGNDSYRVTICYDGVKVYAVIAPVADRTVKFYSNGDLKDTKVVKDGSKVTPPTNIEAPSAGKVLEGWYENSELTGSKYNFDTPISGGDKNFYAKWIDGVSVTFVSNYGSAVETQFLSIGSKATKPSNPSKDHCTFKDWYQNPDFSGSAFDFNMSINENTTLYAKWEYTGSTKHYLVGTFMGCNNWGDCLDNAIEMTKNGDHLEATLANVYKKGADLRFKINRNAKDDWNNSLKWANFSSDRSTGTIATYQAQAQGENIQVNITGDATYSVTMCYDGVSVYAVLAEVQVHKVTFMDGGRNVKEVDVVDGKKTSAPTIEHRGVDLDWYTEPELTNLFDFANIAITADKTLYSKPKAVSGNFYLTGAIWHNWTNENKTPQMTVSNGVASYSFVAPVGNNTIRTLKGSRNEGDYIDARYFDATASSSGINISGDNKQLYFTISNTPKQVTVTFDGRIKVTIQDYTPHFVDNLYLTTNGDWCKVQQADGSKVQTSSWEKQKAANKLRQNGTTGYLILRDVQTGERLWKILGEMDDDSRSGEQLFNAMYVDYTNSVSDGGNFSWNMSNCEALGRQLSYESDQWRNVKFNVNKQCQLKIVFDGGLITVMDLPQYTVSFNTDGGSAVESQTLYEEDRATQPTAPFKPLYKFVKWQLDGEDYDFSTPVTADITLKAVYELASLSIHGPLWRENAAGYNYTVDGTPAFTNDGTTATVSLVAPKGRQTFGILRDRSYAADCMMQASWAEGTSAVNPTTDDGMWFYFELAEASYITITYNAAGKVDVQVDKDYTKKDGTFYVFNYPNTGDKTQLVNGEAIIRNLSSSDKDFKITTSSGDEGAVNGVSRFGGPFVEIGDNAYGMWATKTYAHDWQFGEQERAFQIVGREENNDWADKYWQNAHVHIPTTQLINGTADLKFTFDGKTIRVVPVEHRTVSFNTGEGATTVDAVEAFDGNIAKCPTTIPTRTDGASFIEWRYDGDSFDWDNTPITEDITLTALWDVLQDRADAVEEGGTLTLTHDYLGGNLTVNKQLTIDAQDHTIGNLTITTEGDLTLTSAMTAGNLYITSDQSAAVSGQLKGAASLTLEGNAYIDIQFAGTNAITQGWYAFTVPFTVSSTSGVYNANTGAKLINEDDYAIMQYQGDVRAQGKYGWIKTHKVGGKLYAGTFYIISLGDTEYNIIRFMMDKGSAIAASASMNISKYAYSGSGTSNDAGWNGVGNPNLYYANAEITGLSKLQTYSHDNDAYTAEDISGKNLIVGLPFFVQAKADGNMTTSMAATANAPQRMLANQQTNEEFMLELSQDNKLQDRIYISANDDASANYEIGRELIKMTMGTAKVAQIAINGYNMNLCDADFQLDANNEAIFPLTLTAPKAGDYTLSVKRACEGQNLLVMNGSQVVWDLNHGDYILSLPQGATTTYSLLLQVGEHTLSTGNEAIKAAGEGAQKIILHNELRILKDGKMFNAQGVEL